jgi:hypothetical protein
MGCRKEELLTNATTGGWGKLPEVRLKQKASAAKCGAAEVSVGERVGVLAKQDQGYDLLEAPSNNGGNEIAVENASKIV